MLAPGAIQHYAQELFCYLSGIRSSTRKYPKDSQESLP